MKRTLITNGRVIDPSSGIDGDYEIVIMGDRIAAVKPRESTNTTDTDSGQWDIIDATGMLVTPGLVDIHTHLRDPGYEYKETVETGALSAVAGGFTTILAMANTDPVNDSASVTRYVIKKASEARLANVLPIGAVSVGLRGERLSEMADLADAGCVAFSDDGLYVADGSLMRRALEYASMLSLTVISHSEDHSIAAGGVMNEGPLSTRLGLKGIPNAAEEAAVSRDISIAELTGGRLHVAHVSTKGAVELIRAAQARGVRVTAEATPHHLLLDDDALSEFDTNAKMSPPLRAHEDVEALIGGLRDGTIGAIATDHAPHSTIEKDVEFDVAANGVVGLETSVAITLSLLESGRLTLSDAVRLLSSSPAEIMGLPCGTLKVGSSADITLIDLNKEWVVDPTKLLTKSKNTPFGGLKLKGKVAKTIVGARVVFEDK